MVITLLKMRLGLSVLILIWHLLGGEPYVILKGVWTLKIGWWSRFPGALVMVVARVFGGISGLGIRCFVKVSPAYFQFLLKRK